MPSANLISPGRIVPYSRAKSDDRLRRQARFSRRRARAGTSAMRSRSCGQPTVCAASQASSCRPLRDEQLGEAQRQARRRCPARGEVQSAPPRVCVRRGSMTTTRQPRCCASRRNGMKCGAVLTGLWPQRIDELAVHARRRRAAPALPSVASTAHSAAAPQMLRSSWLAPRRFQNAAAGDGHLHQPERAAVAVRQDRLRRRTRR